MAKNNCSDQIFELVFSLLRCFLVVAAVGPICTAVVGTLNGTSVTPSFLFINYPVWLNNGVYFVDEIQSLLIRYDLNTGKTNSVDTEKAFKFLVPVKGGDSQTFVGGDGDSVTWFSWDESLLEITIQGSLKVLNDSQEVIICGKGDSQGRLFIGTSLSPDQGRLHIVDRTGKVTTAIDNIGMPRDIVWSSDDSRLYILDEYTNSIVCYVYSKNQIILTDKCKEFFDITAKDVNCIAKGMTVDNVGNLWVACYGTSYVVQINAVTQEFMTKVNILDTVSPSNVVFGGKTMEDLYITTMVNPVQEKSGSLFHVANTGYKGIDVHGVEVAWGK